ncbi:MAG: hypothetical protein MI892_04325, partial [Desulfobacterales bacterium]|nr:hypothetical protein [Desulfobacterales bacterium]
GADDWGFSGTVNFTVGYSYYDKEENPEGTSVVTWYLSDDASGTGEQVLATGQSSLAYIYDELDEGKYIRVGVVPVSTEGYTDGVEVFSPYYQVHNCAPQLEGVFLSNNWAVDGKLYAGYSYYDREGDALSSVSYQWYTATDNSGTGDAAVPGATGAEYSPTGAQNGLWFRVELGVKASSGYIDGDVVSSGYVLADNCAPVASGLLAEADDWGFSGTVNFTAGYSYYDKDGDAEGTSIVTWYLSDDALGTGEQVLGTGTSYSYNYTNADENKYISFDVQPVSAFGNKNGNVVRSPYYRVHNCPPQAGTVFAGADDWGFSGTVNFTVGYSYYDKEENPEGTSVVTWYLSDDALGTGEQVLGT